VPKKNDRLGEKTQGQIILDTVTSILERYKKGKAQLAYPGEGGERRFRGWLVSDLLGQVFNWPAGKIVVGEIFDIILQDKDGFPVLTIETKPPYHKATKKDLEDFEKRLSGYGTLRVAYFTNGVKWERLDIFSPQGQLMIQSRTNIELDKTTPQEVEEFFRPFTAQQDSGDTPREGRLRVSKEDSHILESLASHLDQTIANLSAFLERLFLGIREEKAGEHTRFITLNLFNRWCGESLIVSPKRAAELLSVQLQKGISIRDIEKAVSELGFVGGAADAVVEAIGTIAESKRRDAAAITEVLWPAYVNTIKKFCAQTAHVLLARALLYRVGEDQEAFPRLLSGEELNNALTSPTIKLLDAPEPATNLLSRARLNMENFFPTVYMRGEFDWWYVTTDDRPTLKSVERNWLREMDQDFERSIRRLLRMLNGYFFGNVDVDVWRNVYQNYLPADERQRLGGFYTPDLLVDLILDLAEFQPESKDLCSLSFIDPASGSGAFVTGALARLLKHLELNLSCHKELSKRGLPEWKRAETILNIIARNLHAVDIHPFAAFLTTINSFFLLLPLYVKTREKNPDFSLDLQIFSSDSLEKHYTDLVEPDLFAKLNSRVQLAEDAFHRYQEMLKRRFDRVFGNPPWGGVLKGHLSPIYDTTKKNRFSREYPAAAQGKYDVYALFVERALQLLKASGRFGLLTQGTFIDKEWAAGLRGMLASKLRLRCIIDLNPFGQLFFNAMNTPCITVADKLQEESAPEKTCIAVLSEQPDDFKDLSKEDRRKRVDKIIRKAVTSVSGRRKSATVGFAQAVRVSIDRLRKTAKEGWDLGVQVATTKVPKGWFSAADLLEPLQGVTVGGEGCMDLFLMEEKTAEEFKFETDLVKPVIKGIEMIRWKMPNVNQVILYPYALIEEKIQPAFTIDFSKIKDQKLSDVLKRLGILDALDFDKQIDRREQEIASRKGVNQTTVPELLKHRQSLGLVAYPSVASYLVRHYEQLEGRVLEKKNIRQYNKQWYEYHRPRDPEVMLSKGKIITPRLIRKGKVRFALDIGGIIPQDSCICLSSKSKTDISYSLLHKQLSDVLGSRVSREEVLKYCLAFLNSEFSQTQLIAGQRPTPKGFYAITEKSLRRVPIPPPCERNTTKTIIDHVTKLIGSKEDAESRELEKNLEALVNTCLKL
jgi:hypothetical protein